MNQGLLITFEGGEGAGKTSLIEALASTLEERGRMVFRTYEPGSTPLGKSLREMILGHDVSSSPLSERAELLLFLADRAQHVQEQILPALQRGEIVFCDRYTDSTRAYQGRIDGLEETLFESLCTFAASALTPHLTVYLDIDPELGLRRALHSRGGSDRIEQKDLSFHSQVREHFRSLVKKFPKRIHQIDASLPFPEVFSLTCDLLISKVGLTDLDREG